VFNVNDELKVMIIDLDAERGRISLSTKQLEPEPGDMLKDKNIVFAKAEEMAEKYRQKLLEGNSEEGTIAEITAESLELEIPPAIEEPNLEIEEDLAAISAEE